MLAYLVIGAVLVPAAGYAAHQVACHHTHLVVLRALHAPVAVPLPRYGSWWHGIGLARQVVMGAVLVVAGAICGLAWAMSPVAAAASVSTSVAALAVTLGIKSTVRR